MRIMTQLSFEGMRSSVALKDLATSLGFGFMGNLQEKITLWREKLEIRNQELGRQEPTQVAGVVSRMKEEGSLRGGCPAARVTRATAACAALAI